MKVQDLAVSLDAEGFMTDPKQWTPEIAATIAAEEGIPTLTNRHWVVINFARDSYFTNGESPSLRAITKQSGVETKELYDLFPKGPAKKVSRIAGVSSPKAGISTRSISFR
jgi:tRNA 2-thiouridine synthesizing protein E